MNENELYFTVINDEGQEVTLEVLFTAENQYNPHLDYIVYTDGKKDEDGCLMAFASLFNPNDDSPKLIPIESDEEWANIDKILNELIEEYENEEPQTEEHTAD